MDTAESVPDVRSDTATELDPHPGTHGCPEESDSTYPSQLLWAFQLKRQHANHIEKTLAIEMRLNTYDIDLKSLKGKVDRQTAASKEKHGTAQALKKLEELQQSLKDELGEFRVKVEAQQKTWNQNIEQLKGMLEKLQGKQEDSEGNLHEFEIDLVATQSRLANIEASTSDQEGSVLPRKNDKTDAVVMTRRIDAVEANLRIFEAQRRADSETIEQLKIRLAQFHSQNQRPSKEEAQAAKTPLFPESSPSRIASSALVSPLVLKQHRSAGPRLIHGGRKDIKINAHRLRRSARLAKGRSKSTSEIVRFVNWGLKRNTYRGLKSIERTCPKATPDRRLLADGHEAECNGNEAQHHQNSIQTAGTEPNISMIQDAATTQHQSTTPSHHDPMKPTRFWPQSVQRKRRFLEILQSPPVASH
ncbi:hypothetical protein P152DRAFT_474963 [Eremomyces bilateralis CBS 781.70]|uniref:Uncharacterized protein n=1 Tax=Eremomyces bilateralis CBS 781.70 TaxID=1392243 RepID=A0A6G1G070_9PEZI|nr:uncharacterized protein P152DRAFT_474963 [Eremomyces bilateralis CBS 781.70]KAF1811372.1 hypothetical protein P152DRAFT_474963 [Eremomyces bilateralis CBS 781.70]